MGVPSHCHPTIGDTLKGRLLLLYAISCSLLQGAPAAAEHGTPPSDRVLTHMLHADRVVLYRTLDWNHIDPGKRSRTNSRIIDGNETIDSTDVPLDWARRLIPILANPSTWNAGLRKGEPEMVAIVRFSSPGECIDVSLSFQDDVIGVRYTLEAPDGSIRASEFWAGRSEQERVRIIRWLQGAFPGEDRIESLPDQFRGFEYEPPRLRSSLKSDNWRVLDSPDGGSVIVKILIDRNGKPKQCDIVLGSVAHESEAVLAVNRWEFHPATQGKETVEGWATFSLEWIGED